ncbi:MAG TPA: DUF1344 domain-containing protein [Methylomirabilota bacterium]|jgi:Protein of unknown function (DUF1344)|nr:DUF1344 domain-containing protein [Methylomirabilota bacterium]
MSRRTTLTFTLAFGLALLGGGAATAAADSYGEAISTIREIDPDQHVVVLSDGLHLVASDPAALSDFHEGEVVRVRYTEQGGQYVMDRIEQVDQAPSLYDRMHVGEGQSTGARPMMRGGSTFSTSPSDRHDGDYGGAPEPEAP